MDTHTRFNMREDIASLCLLGVVGVEWIWRVVWIWKVVSPGN